MHETSRIKACNRCRQLKARCDRDRQFPRSCTRCAKRHLACLPEASTTNHRQSQLAPTLATTVQINKPPQILTRDDCAVISINQESFTQDEAQHAFDRFFGDMHPHFPLLDPSMQAGECLSHSPALFWTIMTIAMKVISRKRFESLQPLLRTLIADVVSEGHQSLAECQALCLLCVWPLDTVEHRGSDNIHLYARIAHGIATERGLHRPGFQHEYQHTEDKRPGHTGTAISRNRTWCAVYLVDHHVSSRGGLPGSIRPDYALKRMLRTVDVALSEQCRLAIIRDRYLDAIAFQGESDSGLAPPPQRISLLVMFRDEVLSYMDSLPKTSILSLLMGHYTQVSVGGLCLAGDIPAELDAAAVPLVHGALMSAKAIPDILAPLMWETLPMHVLRCLVYAAVYVIQFKRSRFGVCARGIDCDVDSFVERTSSMLLPLSFGRDYATRSRTALKLGQKQQSLEDDTQGAPVLCQSRMGANIYWDLFHCEQGPHKWTVERHQIWSEIMAAVSDG